VGRVGVVGGRVGRGKGVEEGVRRVLRWVEMGSSMRAREVRRKVRRAVVLKQREGVRIGGGVVGLDIVGGGGDLGRECSFCWVGGARRDGGEEGGEGGSIVVQNQASLFDFDLVGLRYLGGEACDCARSAAHLRATDHVVT
jgi:hypothetical protein